MEAVYDIWDDFIAHMDDEEEALANRNGFPRLNGPRNRHRNIFTLRNSRA